MRARAGWWFRPDFIINELNINSAVSRPWHDEVLPLATNNVYTMKGYAYTGEEAGTQQHSICAHEHCSTACLRQHGSCPYAVCRIMASLAGSQHTQRTLLTGQHNKSMHVVQK
jgi:hypothetical protein